MSNWILEYAEVLAAYLGIMFVWPGIVFRKYLQHKSVAFRFAFCTTGMVLLINTVVLTLGLVHLLNPWVVRAAFYGVPAWYALRWLHRNRAAFAPVKYMMMGLCSPKRLITQFLEWVWDKVKGVSAALWGLVRPHIWEYAVMAAIAVYGMLYFGNTAFSTLAYAASDTYVHHSWIHQLLQGNIFSAGVYPEGMHCFIYGMNVLLGADVYMCLVFLQPIHIMAILVSVWLFLREQFSWKFTGLFVLALFLVLEVDTGVMVGSMSRLQWVLPQEFGYTGLFLCAAYLARFLRMPHDPSVPVVKKFRIYRDENLLIFAMALAVTAISHFYTTIIAFFVCLAVGLYHIRAAVLKKKVIPILCAILAGASVAVFPMVGALASGIPFQGSIGWALNVIEDSRGELEEGPKEEPEESDKKNLFDWAEEDEAELQGIPVEELTEEKPEEKNILQKFYEGTYRAVYNEVRAPIMALATAAAAGIGLAGCIYCRVRKRYGRLWSVCIGYLTLVTGLAIYLVLFGGNKVGMITLMEGVRLGVIVHLLQLAVLMIPADFLLGLLRQKISEQQLSLLSVACTAIICVATVAAGCYHGSLYFYQTRYDAAVNVTFQIMKGLEPHSFTIVSPVDELYQIIDSGFHEELVLFDQSVKEESYTLPTEYVFCFVEKQPLLYNQAHFFCNSTLAGDDRYFRILGVGSVNDEAMHTEISEEAAASEVFMPIDSLVYRDSFRRTVLNSRMYAWCRRFMEVYPNTMQVVYEDDAFVCYGFRQNPARLLELAITD